MFLNISSFPYWPIRWQAGTALAVGFAFLALAWGLHRHQAGQVSALDKQVQALRAEATRSAQAEAKAQDGQHALLSPKGLITEPDAWPSRAVADDVTKVMGELAQAHGLVLRSLSMSHQAAAAQAWGQVRWEVAAQGSYAPLKAWQAALQDRFTALSVQSIRLQLAVAAAAAPSPPMNAGGGLEARFTWVLHARD